MEGGGPAEAGGLQVKMVPHATPMSHQTSNKVQEALHSALLSMKKNVAKCSYGQSSPGTMQRRESREKQFQLT